jgi:hypothetical protein
VQWDYQTGSHDKTQGDGSQASNPVPDVDAEQFLRTDRDHGNRSNPDPAAEAKARDLGA